MKSKLITIASFRESHQAYLLKGQLEAEGIPAVIADENLININWLYSQAIGGVKVQVPENMINKANDIIASFEDNENIARERNIDVCPKCGSKSVSQNRYSIWSLLPSLIVMLPILFRRKKWICDSCGFKW